MMELLAWTPERTVPESRQDWGAWLSCWDLVGGGRCGPARLGRGDPGSRWEGKVKASEGRPRDLLGGLQ